MASLPYITAAGNIDKALKGIQSARYTGFSQPRLCKNHTSNQRRLRQSSDLISKKNRIRSY